MEYAQNEARTSQEFLCCLVTNLHFDNWESLLSGLCFISCANAILGTSLSERSSMMPLILGRGLSISGDRNSLQVGCIAWQLSQLSVVRSSLAA